VARRSGFLAGMVGVEHWCKKGIECVAVLFRLEWCWLCFSVFAASDRPRRRLSCNIIGGSRVCTNIEWTLSSVVPILKSGSLALIVLALALGIGVVGYHYLGELEWLDALLNASMILGGMGPMDPLHKPEAKLFASGYALFSGLAFIGVASLLVAPFAHRLLHRFHLDEG